MKKRMKTYTYRRILGFTLLILVLAGVAPLLTTVVRAQSVALITGYPSYVYPGSVVTVTITAYLPGLYTLYLANSNTTPFTVWASQSINIPSPGNYSVSLQLPKKLPDLSKPPKLWILIYLGTVRMDSKSADIYPLIEVSPPATTIVAFNGAFNSVTVYGYGFDPTSSVNEVVFISVNYSGYTKNYTVTSPNNKAGSDGSFNITVSFSESFYIAGGLYNVNVTSDTIYANSTKLGSLRIDPQAVITNGTTHGSLYGNGRCDSTACELDSIYVYGYGFAPNSSIVNIQLVNRNYTGVNYNFTPPPDNIKTDPNGKFSSSILSSYFRTNMSAGDYYLVVYQAPAPQTFNSTSNIPLGKSGSVSLTLPNGVNVSATTFVSGSWVYQVMSSTMSFNKDQVLSISFTYGGSSYMLSANINTANKSEVLFALYNTTTVPYVQLFNVSVASAYNDTLKAYAASLYFNITPLVHNYSSDDVAPYPPGSYVFYATFYNYSNQILLVLRQYTFNISYANLSIVFTAPDGTTLSWYFVYPDNYTFDGVSVLSASVPAPLPSYGGFSHQISFTYNASTNMSTLKVVLIPLFTAQYSFLNQYYLVRPLLVILKPAPAPGPYMPGQSLTIAVYGFGPSSPWPVAVAVNNITILLDDAVLNASVPLGKDGNATIVNVVLPSVITFGVHYLKGRDSWGYEYTEAIIIGVVSYWMKLTGDKTSPLVSARYGDKSLVVCPCPETYVGLKFCDQCAVYTGVCDYLGDNISIIVSGLVPGETVTFYFGGIVVGTAVANQSGIAISPPITIPTVPAGVYQLSVYGSVSGYKTVDYFYNTTAYLPGVYPQVYPKIVLTDLNIVNISPIIVGSGIVRVIGTGFTPGISIVGVLANDTDAISSVNTHVSRWTADSNGVLTASYPGVGVITPALWIPVIEPGAYAIKLIFFNGSTYGATMAGYVFVINNLSRVATTEQVSSIVSSSTAAILQALSSLDNKLSASIAELSGRLDTLISLLTSLNSSLSTQISSLSSQIASARSDILNSISSARSDILNSIASARSDILNSISSVDAKVSALQTSVAGLSDKIDSLTTTINSVVATLTNVTSGLNTVLSQLKSLSDQLTGTLATLTTTVSGLSTAVNDLKTSIATVSSKIDTVNSKIDTLSGTLTTLSNTLNTVNSKVDTLSGAVSTLSNNVNTVSSKVDAVSSKIDTASSSLSSAISDVKSSLSSQLGTASIVLYIAVVLALLSFIFALLSYLSVRKATISK
ncbi:MAG: methyl-accepting chemotaxis protein [Sulfolobales archaeon]